MTHCRAPVARPAEPATCGFARIHRVSMVSTEMNCPGKMRPVTDTGMEWYFIVAAASAPSANCT